MTILIHLLKNFRNKIQSMNKLATVYSFNGTITINYVTGVVMEIEGDTDNALSDITMFDLPEYEKYWKEPREDHYDILDLSGWTKDGKYFKAEPDFREQIKLDRSKE